MDSARAFARATPARSPFELAFVDEAGCRRRSALSACWEVHHDPYDVSQVWVRNHRDGGWISATWKYLGSAPAPFGELAWDHARRQLKDQGLHATEAEIADAVAALLGRAGQGPDRDHAKTGKPSRRDQRVAARTRATAAFPARNPQPQLRRGPRIICSASILRH